MGVDFVSVVRDPALEIKWFAFRNADLHPNCKCEVVNGELILQEDACEFCIEAKRTGDFSATAPRFRFADAEKRMVAGPFMVPDLPIYRRTGEEEFEVYFSAQTIESAVKKFFKNRGSLAVNEEHTSKMAPAYIVESWIVEDPARDKSTAFGFSLPKGTWFGVMHVESQEYWDEMVKTGRVSGFSIEGIMSLVDAKREQKMKQEFSVKTADGMLVANADGTDTLEVGSAVVWVNEDGTTKPVESGDVLVIESGDVLVIEGGMILEIRVPEVMAAEVPAEAPAVEVAAAIDPTEMEALRQEVSAMVADLVTRIAALEGEVAAQRAVIDGQAVEIEKFGAAPGAKSIRLAKTPEQAKENPRLAAFEALENFRNRNRTDAK